MNYLVEPGAPEQNGDAARLARWLGGRLPGCILPSKLLLFPADCNFAVIY